MDDEALITMERAIDRLVEATLSRNYLTPGASYALPDWREGDPRWDVLVTGPFPAQFQFVDAVASEAKKRMAEVRSLRLRAMIDEGHITRPQLASALGVKMMELDAHLDGSEE